MNESTPILDMTTINELTTMLDDGVHELFEEYLHNAAGLLMQLESAAQEGDSEAFRRLLHALKGSSGNLGIANVYRLCKALELEARSDMAGVPPERVKDVEQAFNEAREALRALMPPKS